MKHLYTVLLLFFVFCAKSQTFFVEQSTIVGITTNSILCIEGSAVNKGTFINNGTVELTNDWENRFTYVDPGGTFILKGDVSQLVNHNNQAFNNLIVSGGGEKILQSDATIFGKLDLINGLVTPELGKILLVDELGSVSSGSTFSYVNGALYHTGTGYRYYPIGKNNVFCPVELLNTTGDKPILGMEAFSPHNNPVPGLGVGQISEVRYWKMYKLSGTYSGSPITLTVADDELLTDLDSMVVVQGRAEGQPMMSIGSQNFASNFIKKGVTSHENGTGTIFSLGYRREASEDELFIPKALCPFDANIENRVIKVYGRVLSADGFKFRIYNTWGSLVFETSSLDEMQRKGWTGVNQKTGNVEEIGYFTYVLKGKLVNGKRVQLSGPILMVK